MKTGIGPHTGPKEQRVEVGAERWIFQADECDSAWWRKADASSHDGLQYVFWDIMWKDPTALKE